MRVDVEEIGKVYDGLSRPARELILALAPLFAKGGREISFRWQAIANRSGLQPAEFVAALEELSRVGLVQLALGKRFWRDGNGSSAS